MTLHPLLLKRTEAIFERQSVAVAFGGEDKDLRIDIDIPGIDTQELECLYQDGILTIRKKITQVAVNSKKAKNHIVAESEKTCLALAIVSRIAGNNTPVILSGPSGVGKRLFARRIHEENHDVGEQLYQFSGSEFGLIKGSTDRFMGATARGMIYISELEELNTEDIQTVQALLQKNRNNNRYKMIVGTRIDPDILRRSCHPIIELLDQIGGCYIDLPPLVERQKDIEPLVRYYLEKLQQTEKLEGKRVIPEVMDMLTSYSWPGNVRELKNTLKQILLTTGEKKTVFVKDLPKHIRIKSIHTSAKMKRGL